MSAGTVQLVSVGAQDVHLSGKPEISFFKQLYKRHTNFSVFHQLQHVVGTPAAGRTSTVRVERFGDLLGSMFITVSLAGESQLLSVWSDVIESVDLLVGGQVIDTQDVAFTEEIAIDTMATSYSKSYPASHHGGKGSQSFFYPLRFFFCENWGSCLPLIALQYHDVEIQIKWSANFNQNYLVNFFGTYVSLDTEERELMTQPRDILIFQVQKSTPSHQKIQELNFNHPVRFIASSNANISNPNVLVSRTNRIKFEANGVDITPHVPSVPYYTAVQAYYNTDFSYANSENMFLYSWCLNTNKLQPCGSLNFSRIDSFKIHSDVPINTPVYAVNLNILRVKNGMAGLLFSN